MALGISLFYPSPICYPQTFTLSQDSKISLFNMGFTSPLKAVVLCLQNLSRSRDERQCRFVSLITKAGVVPNPNQPPVCPWFPEMTCTCPPRVPQVTYRPRTTLLRWRPSGIAKFSSFSSSKFSITCSDISLVSFRVYSDSWEVHGSVSGILSQIILVTTAWSWGLYREFQLGRLIFCPDSSIFFRFMGLVTLKMQCLYSIYKPRQTT